MFEEEYRPCLIAGVILTILISLIAWAVSVDLSELTPYSYNGVVVDKWHTTECDPIYDGDGTYVGESCSDVYEVVADLEEYGRLEKRISHPEFRQLVVGSPVTYSFKEGKLGWLHEETLSLAQ